MKCINTSCQSTRIKIEEPQGSVIKNGVNILGAAACVVACFTPYHHAAGKAAQELWENGNKSVKVKCTCKDCGCTWEITKWT